MRIIIEGPSGCGKTTTAIEIAKFLRERGCSVNLVGSNPQHTEWLERASRKRADRALVGEVKVMDIGNGPKLGPPPDPRDGIMYSSSVTPGFWGALREAIFGSRK